MNKPFSIICEEFKQELASLINNCGLPPYMIAVILQNYLYEVNEIAKNQYHSDKAQYEKTLKEKAQAEKLQDESNIDGD